ncbi:hypothetical protein BX616_002292, partial [Lobosporangium transversale]
IGIRQRKNHEGRGKTISARSGVERTHFGTGRRADVILKLAEFESGSNNKIEWPRILEKEIDLLLDGAELRSPKDGKDPGWRRKKARVAVDATESK